MTSFQKIMMLIGLAGLTVALLVPLVLSVTPQLRRVRKLFFFAVAGLALYAGAKRSGTITYPDIGGVNYLINRGSYITNDYVHIDFTTVAIPSSANLYIARKQLDVAEAQWVEHLETTIADFNPPQDLQFANATNYDWMVFSDWTPGPAVETNGVWHCYWGLDQQLHEKLIPLRTCITVNGDVIATPKSKAEHLKNPYISDGLYAMYDGIWNAGLGIHQTSISSWKDLVGNNDAEIDPSQVFEDYAFEDGIHQCKLITMIGLPFTIEICTTDINQTSAWFMLMGSANDFCSIGIQSKGGNPSWKTNNGAGSTVKFSGGTISARAFDDKKYQLVSNGNTFGAIADSGDFRGQGTDLVWSKPWNQNRGTKKVHCIRIYSRALSDDEIAHNNAIDKARFNLP